MKGDIAMNSIELGQKVEFNRFYGVLHELLYISPGCYGHTVGTIIAIHPDHRWFSVEYFVGDTKMRTTFNFSDIGKTVKIHKKRTRIERIAAEFVEV